MHFKRHALAYANYTSTNLCQLHQPLTYKHQVHTSDFWSRQTQTGISHHQGLQQPVSMWLSYQTRDHKSLLAVSSGVLFSTGCPHCPPPALCPMPHASTRWLSSLPAPQPPARLCPSRILQHVGALFLSFLTTIMTAKQGAVMSANTRGNQGLMR